MQRETARHLMIAGAVLLLVWLLIAVLRLVVWLSFVVGIVLLTMGALIYAVSPRR